MTTKPSVYQYWDYRKFLSDLIEHLRSKDGFSLRKLSEEAGFGSVGYLSMILNRKRNISKRAAEKISKALDLADNDTKFFVDLVAFNQELDFEVKDALYKKLLRSKSFMQVRRVETLQYEFLSDWRHAVVFEAMASPLDEKDLGAWAEGLRMSREELKESLRLLERLGFAERIDRAWHRKDLQLQTNSNVFDLAYRNFHRQMMDQARQSLDSVEAKDREVLSLTISLSHEKFEEVRKLALKFQQDINSMYSEDPNPESIYQLNLQLFPLARRPR